MAWLARLDARARRWPRPLFWPYVLIKWYLIAAGAFLACGLAYTELSEKRVGLGVGIGTVTILAIIKGVLVAISTVRATDSPAPRPPS